MGVDRPQARPEVSGASSPSAQNKVPENAARQARVGCVGARRGGVLRVCSVVVAKKPGEQGVWKILAVKAIANEP